MALATRTIDGNNSGPLLRVPKVVVMHSTRSGIASKTDAQELISTMNWFTNPAGSSAHWILSKLEIVRCVADTLRAWHSAWLNGLSWGVELTQPTIDRTFGAGHYANAALVGRHYVKLGVAPVWLDYWDGNLNASGFVDHEDTIQGRASGKSDIGYRFDRARFIASLEAKMTPEDEKKVQEMITASLRTWIGPRDNTTARIDRELQAHRNDAAKHGAGGGTAHPHEPAKHTHPGGETGENA